MDINLKEHFLFDICKELFGDNISKDESIKLLLINSLAGSYEDEIINTGLKGNELQAYLINKIKEQISKTLESLEPYTNCAKDINFEQVFIEILDLLCYVSILNSNFNYDFSTDLLEQILSYSKYTGPLVLEYYIERLERQINEFLESNQKPSSILYSKPTSYRVREKYDDGVNFYSEDIISGLSSTEQFIYDNGGDVINDTIEDLYNLD